MTPERALSSRQELILRQVVEAYIAHGLPVGSKTLVAGGIEASSSTVRYELAELEQLGMLAHPHTSAGRVPTDHGYRYYADLLLHSPMPPAPLPVDLSAAQREIDAALRTTADTLAQMTNLLAVVSSPSLETTIVRHVELLRLQPQVVMAVVITSTGGVAKRLFVFQESVDSGLVDWAASYLNDTVTGLNLGARMLRKRLEDPELRPKERAFLTTIAPVFTELVDAAGETLHVGGQAALLGQLQARDIVAVRQLVHVLEERWQLLAVLRDALDADWLTVRIGSELPAPALRSLALVAANYGLANRKLGTVSLVGPTRMDYSSALRSVRGAAAALSEFVEDIYG
jgi:heat-inducible transcriptional repressor